MSSLTWEIPVFGPSQGGGPKGTREKAEETLLPYMRAAISNTVTTRQ